MFQSSTARLVLAYALLCLCWMFTTPPFSAPDEWSHYLRALGASEGHLVGARVESFHDPALDPRQEAWVAQTVRWTDVRPGMSPEGYGCNAFHPEQSAACVYRVPPPPREWVRILTVNGTYQPAPYLLPALALRGATDPVFGLLRVRAVNALCSLALIALAAAALAPNLLGLLIAVTPMVLFLASMLNPSGVEIAGALAFSAGLLGLARPHAGRYPWWATASGGAALCLSRSLGPGWLVVIAGVWLLWLGPREAWRSFRGWPRAAASSAIVIGLSTAANRAWEAAYGPRLPARSERLELALIESVKRVPGWVREQIGVFQYLDAPMPRFAYGAWFALVLLLVLGAAWAGTRRERAALAMAIAMAIGAPVLLHALAMRPIGWIVQGRHVLPLTVIVPLLSAEIAGRHTNMLHRTFYGVIVLTSTLQFVAVYANARRSAVGTSGPWSFVHALEWSPPLGWCPWLLALALGCLLLCTVRVASLGSRPGEAPTRPAQS